MEERGAAKGANSTYWCLSQRRTSEQRIRHPRPTQTMTKKAPMKFLPLHLLLLVRHQLRQLHGLDWRWHVVLRGKSLTIFSWRRWRVCQPYFPSGSQVFLAHLLMRVSWNPCAGRPSSTINLFTLQAVVDFAILPMHVIHHTLQDSLQIVPSRLTVNTITPCPNSEDLVPPLPREATFSTHFPTLGHLHQRACPDPMQLDTEVGHSCFLPLSQLVLRPSWPTNQYQSTSVTGGRNLRHLVHGPLCPPVALGQGEYSLVSQKTICHLVALDSLNHNLIFKPDVIKHRTTSTSASHSYHTSANFLIVSPQWLSSAHTLPPGWCALLAMMTASKTCFKCPRR